MENVKLLNAPDDEGGKFIVISQLPVIEEWFDRLKAEIKQRTSIVYDTDCTEENKTEVKALRAALTKEKNSMKEAYGRAVDKVMAPIYAIEHKYKLCLDVYSEADRELKERISVIENGLKEQKRKEALSYFKEYAALLGIDFVTLDDAGVKINLTVTMKSLQKQISAFLERVAADLKMIDMQADRDEILVEYKKSLDVTRAVTAVSERRKMIESEKRRRIKEQTVIEKRESAAEKVREIAARQEKADKTPLSPPTVENIPKKLLSASFAVEAVDETVTIDNFKKFKQDLPGILAGYGLRLKQRSVENGKQ